MAWLKGFDVRATIGGATDPANCTYVLFADTYPTTRNGVTFGWTVQPTNCFDMPYGQDARVYGKGTAGNTVAGIFKVDLPAAGKYVINLALGDEFARTAASVAVKDTSTTVLSFGPVNTIGTSAYDATATEYTWTNWPASQAGTIKTFATTTLNVEFNATTSNYIGLQHLFLSEAEPAALRPLYAVTMQALTASSGTYTPTTNMAYVLGMLFGGGAGGISATSTDGAGGGGGAGGAVTKLWTAATIGASQAYAVGQSANAGVAGNATSLGTAGALANAPGGGIGAETGSTTTLGVQSVGGSAGVGATGDLNMAGNPGGRGIQFSGADGQGGDGGSGRFGGGGAGGTSNVAGSNATAYGSGGGGGQASGVSDKAGGTGSAGVIYLLEFLRQAEPSAGLFNNYQFVDVGDGGSTTDKIK